MLVVCTGTATDIGKTWVGAATLTALRAAGMSVAARKPAQSFDPADTHPTDAEVLAASTGEDPHRVCPEHRWYPVAMAPPMAADALGRPPFTLADLVGELALSAVDVAWVETAGGPRSPLAGDGDTVDLCGRLGPDLVVLVADAGLGTINAVRMAADALTAYPLAVVLNRYHDSDDLHRRNRAWLADYEPVVDAAALAERIRCST